MFFNFFISNSIRAEYFSSYSTSSSYFWKPVEVVSFESTDSAYDCDLDVDNFGNVHICWHDGTNNYLSSGSDTDIFYRVWNAETRTWSSVSLISSASTDNSFWPDIYVEASGDIHVVWYDSPSVGDKDIFYRRYDKTSSQWMSVETVSTESTGHSDRPSIVVDGSGDVHVSWRDGTNYLGSGDMDNDIFYKRKDKATDTWTVTEVISNDSTDHSEYPCLAVDASGNVHIVWDDSDESMLGSGSSPDIFYRRWNKINKQWEAIELVSTETTSGARKPYIATDAKNDLHVVWIDYTDFGDIGGTEPDICYKRFDFASGLWTTTEVVSTESDEWSMAPSLVVDRYGFIHVAWEDISNYQGAGDTEYDIFYKSKDPSSGTWQTTTLISTISTAASYDPKIDVDDAGMVHIAWNDLTDYEGAIESYHDIFYTKYGGVPETPVLNVISPNTSDDGVITLDWDDTFGALQYYVYRDTSTISSVSGLTPISQITSSAYTETLSLDGTYYYAIVAENYLGNSSVSNSESIEVSLLTTTTTTTTESKSSPSFSLITGLLGLLSVGVVLLYRKRRYS